MNDPTDAQFPPLQNGRYPSHSVAASNTVSWSLVLSPKLQNGARQVAGDQEIRRSPSALTLCPV